MTFPVIAGHRQANHTECPGNIFYPLLPTVRLEAAGRPQAPIVALVRVSPARFSPNGDGVLDKTALSLSLTKKANWHVELRGAGGKRLVSYSGEGASAQVTWPGADAAGHAFADGVYTAVVLHDRIPWSAVVTALRRWVAALVPASHFSAASNCSLRTRTSSPARVIS